MFSTVFPPWLNQTRIYAGEYILHTTHTYTSLSHTEEDHYCCSQVHSFTNIASESSFSNNNLNHHQDAIPFSPQNTCSSNITILRKPHIRHPPLGRASKQLHIRLLPLQLVLVQPHRPLPILHPRLRLRLRLHFPLTFLQKPSRHQLPARHPTQHRQHIQLEWTIHDADRINSIFNNSQNQRVESFLSFFAFAYKCESSFDNGRTSDLFF